MGWAELPPDIIEKIVGYAANGDRKGHVFHGSSFPGNRYAMRVLKYGQVHPMWSEAIRLSRNIFQSFSKYDKSIPQQVSVGRCGGPIVMQPFIRSGYLQAVKSLCLFFDSGFDLKFIHDAIAARNSVEHFSVLIAAKLSEKVARQIIELLTRLTKMSLFNITIKVETQALVVAHDACGRSHNQPPKDNSVLLL